jgi:DNA-directed RNA polymerase subunit F
MEKPFDKDRYKKLKKKKENEGLTPEEKKEWSLLKKIDRLEQEKIPKIKPKEDEEPVMPPPVAVDISDTKDGIPNALKSIKNAKSVEEWLDQASTCRVVLDKEDFSKDRFFKVIIDKFDEYKYECGFRLNILENGVEFVTKKNEKIPVTPEEIALSLGDCEEFICYVAVRKEQSGHANLLVLRDKVLYRFDPHGQKGSKIQDDFIKEFAKILGVKYSPVAESCPRFGVQHKALDISKRGLCNIWSLLFIEIFLINKEKTLPQVEALFEKLSPEQLANVMFNYFWSLKSEMIGGGLNAKKVQHFASSSYKKNKDIKGIGNYRLDNSLSTREAKVFVNKDTGKVVVANRGTTPTLKDWTNNLSLLLGQYKNTARYKNARNIQVKVLEKYPEFQVLNVGHSQGAAITKRLNEEGLTGEVININPASLPTDRKKDNETTIRSSGDIVSMYDRPKKGDIMLKAKSLNPFEEHRPTIVGELPPKTYIGKGFHSKFEWFC